MNTDKRPNAGRITPLGVIASFLTLAEGFVTLASTAVSGWHQTALIIFAVSFPLIVSIAFFAILWNRPWVLYPPSEYGQHVDAPSFINAIRQPAFPEEFVRQIEIAKQQPNDEEPRFTLIDSLIDMAVRQQIILMHEQGVRIPFGYFGPTFETGGGLEWSSGSMSGDSLCKKLNGTGLLEITTSGPAVVLTESGHRFAEWLVTNGKKAGFLRSDIGGWGTPTYPDGLPPAMRERFGQKATHGEAPKPSAEQVSEAPVEQPRANDGDRPAVQ